MNKTFVPALNAANKINVTLVAVTASSQDLTIPDHEGLATVRIANIGNQTVFIDLNGAATTSSMPILANSVEVFDFGIGTDVSAIAAAAGSTLYITVGRGD